MCLLVVKHATTSCLKRLNARHAAARPFLRCYATTHGVLHGPHLCPDIAEDVVERINVTHAIRGKRIAYQGTGTQLGLDATWRLVVGADGGFREEIKTAKFTTVSGYDPGASPSSASSPTSSSSSSSSSWSGDHTGMSSYLEFDDHELVLLVNWARSGLWSSPAVRRLLVVDVISTALDEAGCPVATVRLRMKDGRVTGTVSVDMTTMKPQRVAFHLRGDSEKLEFLDWAETSDGVQYPKRIEYDTMSGKNLLLVDRVIVGDDTSEDHHASFAMPACLDMPLDTEFCGPTTHELPAWITHSGHLLVRAAIDGDHESAGYWLFDTGASGSVIDSAAAARLGLEAFGSFKVKGMAGDLDGKFRECKTMELGPLKVKNMLMMEMDCSGLVRGGPGPVVGIIGCDILSRAVFDIPRIVRRKDSGNGAADADGEHDEDREVTSLAAAMARSMQKNENSLPTHGSREITITMHDPRIEPTIRDESKWMKVRWVSSLPHLDITCVNGDVRDNIMFMIDSGAGGMQLMMNGLTASQLKLMEPDEEGNRGSRGTRTVRGVGGSSTSSIRLQQKRLKIAIGDNVSMKDVDCLVAEDGIQGGVELSHYTGGVLCNDVLVHYRFVVDLARDRMALI